MKLVIHIQSGKSYLVRDESKDFHNEFGFLKADDMQKAKPGQKLQSNMGQEFLLLEPSFMDMYRKIRRAPQIIPLKDVGSIISETGIGKSSVVLDSGTGSGALACFLGHVAKKVISYELREDFAAVANENIQKLGLKNVTVKLGDIYLACSEKNIDVAIFDLPEPWKAIPTVMPCIRPGGYLVSYSPSIPQVMDFVEAARQAGLLVLKTVEIAEREWEVDGRKVRPLTKEIGHSGFITYCRRMG